jgi:PGM1 C-terminal domain
VICAARPGVDAVIVKHDNSGAGDGNVVLSVDRSGSDLDAVVRAAVESLPQWYLDDLQEGGIVEERIAGVRFTSPSVQVDVDPDGDVVVLSTHEQVLSGEHEQVYSGCRFPADPAYAAELARHGLAIGRALAGLGAMGRMAIDFAAAQDEEGRWSVHALEVNLRKGGTSHPFTTLRHLVPGRYDAEEGRWRSDEDDSPRWYQSTDNLLDPAWTVLSAGQVVDAIRDAGLAFDPARGCGVVLHMLAGLAVDGRFGLTAIGRTEVEAEALYEGAVAAVHALCD